MGLIGSGKGDMQKNPADLVGDVYEAINEKCNYGEAMEALNEYERVFYVVLVLQTEVDNGGFSQFFYNYSGCFSGELISALTKINAASISAICRKALNAFGTELPIDTTARRAMLERLENDETEKILSACDREFYKFEDELTKCCYEFIQSNKASFDS